MLKKRFMGTVVAMALVGVVGVVGIGAATPASANADVRTVEYGASWDFGSIPGIHGWSNLFSSVRDHSSTVTTVGKSQYSGWTSAGNESYAELWWSVGTFNAYYNI